MLVARCSAAAPALLALLGLVAPFRSGARAAPTTLTSTRLPQDPPSAAFQRQLVAHARPLPRWNPGSADTGIHDFGPLVDKARIVGLGEATHGSHELFELKLRVLVDLVLRHEVRVLGLEAGFVECLGLDAFVCGTEGDGKVLLAALGPFPWFTEELLATVLWIREHNCTVPAGQEVHFLGLDAGSTTLTALQLHRYLTEVDEEYREESWSTGEEIAQFLATAGRSRPGPDAESEGELLAILLDRFDTEEDEWIAASDAHAFAVARELCVTLQRFLESAGPPDPDRRDRDMAKRAEWMADRIAGGGRVALWMHNAHIARNGLGALRSTGGFLAGSVGAAYLALGTAFESGGFRAFSGGSSTAFTVPAAPANSFASAFASAGHDCAWWSLHWGDEGEELNSWLATPRPVHLLGGTFSEGSSPTIETAMDGAFDAVFFVKTTTPAHVLD